MSRLTYIDALEMGQIKGLQLLGCKWACDNSKSCENCLVGNAITKLAEYENLEELGKLITLPVQVDDIVFRISKDDLIYYMDKYKITQIVIDRHGFYIMATLMTYGGSSITLYPSDFGETVFLSYDEAMKKIKEME